jgi:hypothetical protein
MKPILFQAYNGIELSVDQLHALRLNSQGKLEEQTNSMLSNEEIEALQRIQSLLDELKFGSDTH